MNKLKGMIYIFIVAIIVIIAVVIKTKKGAERKVEKIGDTIGAEENELKDKIISFLDCTCSFFPSGTNTSLINKAYKEAQLRGKKENFVPILVVVEENLYESFLANSNEDADVLCMEKVRKFRTEALDKRLESGKELLDERLCQLREDMEDAGDDDFDEDEEDVDGEAVNGFYNIQETNSLILAEIPVRNAWEVFAWLPFGGWNECPDEIELMSVAKYWYECYKAVPATMSSDVLEFCVPCPVHKEECRQLAFEQYAFCPDIVDQGVGSVKALEKMLSKSTVWFFWWD